MTLLLILIFLIGYAAIALEHVILLNKASSALIMGVLSWVVLAFMSPMASSTMEAKLMHAMSEISGILFFILGAMTIVEIIDSHDGFDLVTSLIKTNSKRKLMWTIGTITFFMSAILDNLTTAIVMISMVSRLLENKKDRWRFGGIIIIAANAGGAFSPLGDVTTTMLWVGNQITSAKIITALFIPSIISALVPMVIMHFQFGNETISKKVLKTSTKVSVLERKLFLFSGVSLLCMVPVFKTVTHLPPFMGILLAVGLMWLLTSFVHKGKDDDIRYSLSVANALQKIDTPSVLFFLGILLTISALSTANILQQTATLLSTQLKTEINITSALGILSAIIDNVPLVAAAQGMYTLNQYPTDHTFWHLLALTTGTGGSMIIIGTAAGVAVMAYEKIPFGWYLKNIGSLAAIGFILAILSYILLY
jgi:Na+/H+ antiporter NhaD/arsenite permease-like protein